LQFCGDTALLGKIAGIEPGAAQSSMRGLSG
jgi:hypothetical protein